MIKDFSAHASCTYTHTPHTSVCASWQKRGANASFRTGVGVAFKATIVKPSVLDM
ncbi:hypothetical protein COCCADRAFT_81349 [Bipolaris zeicola 26-R-13]|uniref:Uncharacterized protein n=1 Tax=Cochliobolus carbonum (strain 26-R-13) TaxID=930089 RepID=W6YUF3_COCC2|nr:uncharacterized protein COCCADRAFT_81349 [Bipolaris zeicola 26-R-13]EUC39084.1 hypothetical protein COCCADRAFT_81349 [Bipolaris zeicola 26-R-13]